MYTLLVTGDVPGASTYFNPLLQQTVIPCTSGARPSSPTNGMLIYETDTQFYRSWNSSDAAWVVVFASRKLWCRKPSDQSRSGTTTVSADTHLLIPNVPASTYYHLTGTVIYNGDTAADMKGGFYGPASSTFNGTYRAATSVVASNPAPVVMDAQTMTGSFVFGTIGTGTDMTAFFDGVLYSGDGGTVGFQWAQFVSSGTATTVKAASYLMLTPLA